MPYRIYYDSFDDAALRVEHMVEKLGVWTGIVCCQDGTFRLLYDPAVGIYL